MRSPIFVAYKRMSLSYCSKKKDNMRPNKNKPSVRPFEQSPLFVI